MAKGRYRGMPVVATITHTESDEAWDFYGTGCIIKAWEAARQDAFPFGTDEPMLFEFLRRDGAQFVHLTINTLDDLRACQSGGDIAAGWHEVRPHEFA